MKRQDLKLAVCVDLDGTLADYCARQHLMPPSGSHRDQWREFHLACEVDMPFAGIALLVESLYPTHQIHFVSGRFVEMHTTTSEWLAKHDIPYDVLRLYTPDDAPTKNEVYKSQYIELLRREGINPILFIEDQAYVANYIEERTGIPVLCVDPRYERQTV